MEPPGTEPQTKHHSREKAQKAQDWVFSLCVSCAFSRQEIASVVFCVLRVFRGPAPIRVRSAERTLVRGGGRNTMPWYQKNRQNHGWQNDGDPLEAGDVGPGRAVPSWFCHP
jgi:hypothetical protein